MALNPALVDDVPVAVDGELFMLQRGGIAFESKIEGLGKFSAQGTIFVTTFRIVFVATAPTTQHGLAFQSFDIPIKNIQQENFNQPIFGANNMTGVVLPVVELGLRVPARWKISFRQGGVGVFLPVFLQLMQEFRRAADQAGAWQGAGDGGVAGRLVSSMTQRHQQQQAFVDPNDPSVVFVSQPAFAAAAEGGGGAQAAPPQSTYVSQAKKND